MLMLQHRLYFLRHGETEWNRERRLQGLTDIPLNDIGRAQAKRHGNMMRSLDEPWENYTFWVSPMVRARETFTIIHDILDVDIKARFDPLLQEGSFGRWEGLTWSDVIEREPENHMRWFENSWDYAPHEGNTYRDLSIRFTEWASNMTGPSVIISHGGISRAVRALYLDIDKTKLASLSMPQDRFMCLEKGEVIFL